MPREGVLRLTLTLRRHFLAMGRWSCPDLVDSEQILRREQLINLPGCLEPLLFEVLRAQITQR